MNHRALRILLMASVLLPAAAAAENHTDSATLLFRVSKDYLDFSIPGNESELSRILSRIRSLESDSTYNIGGLTLVGGASPEGSIVFNRGLSRRRAKTLFDYIGSNTSLPDSLMKSEFVGRDWEGLARLVAADPAVPYHRETLAFVERLAEEAASGRPVKTDAVERLKRFNDGLPYRYMLRHLFPALRASRLRLGYSRLPEPVRRMPLPDFPDDGSWPGPSLPLSVPRSIRAFLAPEKPFYMDISTNMLFDAALVPNIGVEFYLGKNFSVMANWMYSWWKHDRTHWYWRVYGGYAEGRWWFGEKARLKPLTGHHLGLYAQMGSYDLELGGRGRLAPRWSYGGGVSYGYSLPVARRINIDFTLGVGYYGGTYKEYVPVGTHYVWQATKKLHWVGPTKAEISLVWLVGRGNYNIK